MSYTLIAYIYGKHGFTKDHPKKITEESSGNSLYEAKKNLFNKYRKESWWFYNINYGGADCLVSTH